MQPVYDFTQPAGDPFPGTLPGLWNIWTKAQMEIADHTAHSYAKNIMAAPAPVRVACIDTEGVGYDAAEKLLPPNIRALQNNVNVKTLIIGDFWPGLPPDFSFQKIVKAMEGPASKDRAQMFTLARKHRHIVRAAGVIVVNSTIWRLKALAHLGESADGFDFFVRKTIALCKFYREAYAGTEVCIWAVGARPHEEWAEIPPDECRQFVERVRPHCDSWAVYGEKRWSGNIMAALTRIT